MCQRRSRQWGQSNEKTIKSLPSWRLKSRAGVYKSIVYSVCHTMLWGWREGEAEKRIGKWEILGGGG